SGRSGLRGRGLLRGLRGGADVLLADPAADAGALDRLQVDTLLLGELAHDRGDVGGRGRLGSARTRGGLGRRGGSLLRRRGLDLGGHLRLAGDLLRGDGGGRGTVVLLGTLLGGL